MRLITLLLRSRLILVGIILSRVGGWVGGWLEKMKIEQSSASAGLKLAELGNNLSIVIQVLTR